MSPSLSDESIELALDEPHEALRPSNCDDTKPSPYFLDNREGLIERFV